MSLPKTPEGDEVARFVQYVIEADGKARPAALSSGGGGGTSPASQKVEPTNAGGLPVTTGSDGLTVLATAAAVGLPVRAGSGGLAVSPPDADGLAVKAGASGLAVAVASAPPIASERAFLRDDFPGVTLDATKWDWTPGAGASMSIAGSILTLNSGTTAGVTSILRSKTTFTLPCRLWALLALSQRIANTEVYLEFVNAAGTTRASWMFQGTSTTGATAMSTNDNTKADADASVTISNSAALTAYELDGDDTGWDWNERTLASSAQPSLRQVRSRTVPGGGEALYAQLRIVNLATAPASSTAVTVEALVAHATTRLPVEISRGRGLAGANDSVPVVVNGVPNVTTGTASQAAQRPVVFQQDETTTALGASGSYSGGTRDNGGADVGARSTRLRWTYAATAAALGSVAHLYLDESIDGTTWLTTQQTPLPADGLPHTGEWSFGHFRYYRMRVVNGTTAQTALRLTQIMVRGDGSTADTRANLPIPLTPAAGTILAVSQIITGPTLDLGVNHQWDRARLVVDNTDANASGTAALQVSQDGSRWRSPITSTAVAVNSTASTEITLGPFRYVRGYYANGATAATAGLTAALSLVSL